MSIILFGLRLTRAPSPDLEPVPNVIQKKHWKTQLSGNKLILDIQLVINQNHTLTVSGTFHIKRISTDDWGFTSSDNDGIFRLTDSPGWDRNSFELKLGWLSVRSRRFRYIPRNDGELTIDIPDENVFSSDELPLEINVNGSASNLSLDLAAYPNSTTINSFHPRVIFSKGSFIAETFTSVLEGRMAQRYFRKDWHSNEIALDLNQSSRWNDLELETQSQNTALPLHAFKWPGTSNVSPSLSAITNKLKLSLSFQGSGTLLERVRISEGILHNYAYHDNKRNPLSLNYKKDIELSIQPLRSHQRVASFILSPKDQQGNVQTIAVTRANDALNFLGLRTGMRFPIVKKSTIEIHDEDSVSGTTISGVVSGLLKNTTGPVLKPSNLSKIEHAIAGEAFISEASTIRTWNMKSSNGILPMLPDVAIKSNPGFQKKYQTRINNSLSTYADTVQTVNHESNLVQGKLNKGNEVKFKQVLKPDTAPTFAEYQTDYEYGGVQVTHKWESGIEQDHFLIHVNQTGSKLSFADAFQLDPTSKSTQLIRIKKSQPIGIPSNKENIQACVKLKRGRKLVDLLKAGGAIPAHISEIIPLLPDVVKSEDWIGLIVFGQHIDLSGFPLLESMVDEEIYLPYLAISPPRTGGTNDEFSVYSRLIYKNENSSVPHPGSYNGVGDSSENQQKEVYIQIQSLDVTWTDRRMTKFHSETLVRIRSFLGLSKEDSEGSNIKPTDINIIGAIDRDSGDIKFLALSNQPVSILPDDGFGPLKHILLKKIEIIRVNNETKVDIDGDVKLKPLEIDGEKWFDASDSDHVKFKGFGFWFNKLTVGGDWLKFDYPSFQFQPGDGGFSLLSLPFIKVKLKGLGIDFPESEFSWGTMVEILRGWDLDWSDLNNRKFAGRFQLGFELAKLPFLTSKSFDALTFDFQIGVPFSDSFNFDLSKLRLYLSAVGFNKLNLDLMRFLSVRADRVRLEAKELDGQNVPWFLFENVDVDILSKSVVEDLTFAYFSVPNGERGFLGLIEQGFDGLPFIRVDWVLIGKNLSIPTDLAKEIVSIQPSDDSNISQQIWNAYENNELIPLSDNDKKTVGEWIFAAGIDVLQGFLIGKFMFQDGAYYGISLNGVMLKEWFGWDFAISILYIQRNRPEEDSFYIQIRLPMFSIGAFTFKGGVVALEIQMNGGFLLDVGFPWLQSDGIRNWDRSQGLFISGLMGKGGMYIAKRTSVRVVENNSGQKLVMFAAGQAAMVGIGGAYSKGPFRVEAYAGIYIVGEGALLFRRSTVVGLRLVGAIGIQVRGIGELNWWIISIRIEVIIGAEARLTLRWGIEFNPATGCITDPDQADDTNDVVIQLDFVLYARISARACIGKGWFKICKGISVGVSLPYRQKLLIGV